MANSAPNIKRNGKANWPASAVEWRKIDKLTPYARNARTHSDEQIDQIAASIKEWGWTIPVLVDEEDGIIAGHGRVMAARRLDIVDVPVLVARGWTTAQKAAYTLADNKLTLNGGWNTDFLKVEIEGLREVGFNLPLVGFSTSELDLLMNGWNSTIDPLAEHGENLDGIRRGIHVMVDQDIEEKARDVIKEALGDAGITFEFK